MSFTYDLATDIGKTRLKVRDTAEGKGVLPGRANLSDEEIQVLLTDEGSVGRAVAAAFELLAGAWANVSESIAAGPRNETFKQADQYRAQAKLYRARFGGGAKSFAISTTRTDGYSAQADANDSEFARQDDYA